MNLSYGRVNNKELILKIPGIRRWSIRQDAKQHNQPAEQRNIPRKFKLIKLSFWVPHSSDGIVCSNKVLPIYN